MIEKKSAGPNGLTYSTNSVPTPVRDTAGEARRATDREQAAFDRQLNQQFNDVRPGNSPFYPK